VVFASTTPEAGARGISAFLVPTATPGCRFGGAQVMAAPHPLGILDFEACHLPAEALLGEVDQAWTQLMAGLNVERLILAATMLGIAQRAFDDALAYVKERKQFGRPIGSFQALQHRLAMCTVWIEGTRRLTFEAAGLDAPEEAAAVAAAHATHAANEVFREMHQMTGAMGFTREHDLHVFSMRLQALRLELGGASAHRRAIAASRWNAAS
jgi:alkylation response protein AidB-like acyl-CoA dehydrogenase